MKSLLVFIPTAFLVLLIACGGGSVTPTPNPTPSPTPGLPTVPPDTTPVAPTPTPGNGNVPHYGEWIVTYTSDTGVSFVHALEVTDNVSSDGLLNAGGGLQEFCTGGSGDECEGIYGSGIGFIGNLVLDDGTSPLTLAIATSYGGASPEVKLLTLEDIQMTTNGQGQQTFTADAGWALSTGDIDLGSITATNVGAPRTLDPLNARQANSMSAPFIRQIKELRQ